MLVPPAMIDLHETDAALGQAPRQQTHSRRTCRACALPVRRDRALAWALSEMSVRSGTEVCIRKAISYWAMRVWISGSPHALECRDGSAWPIRRASCGGRRHRRRAGFQEQHRIARDARSATPWCLDGKKPAPHSRVIERLSALPLSRTSGDHDHERRQVFVLAAKAVAESTPRCSAVRAPGCRSAGSGCRDHG